MPLWCVCVSLKCVCVSRSSHVQLFATLWTVARQAPLSMGILQARILEWVAIPFCRGSSQPNDPRSPALQADSLLSEPPWKPLSYIIANGSTYFLARIFQSTKMGQEFLHRGTTVLKTFVKICWEAIHTFH